MDTPHGYTKKMAKSAIDHLFQRKSLKKISALSYQEIHTIITTSRIFP
jgi:hypothetical protein